MHPAAKRRCTSDSRSEGRLECRLERDESTGPGLLATCQDSACLSTCLEAFVPELAAGAVAASGAVSERRFPRLPPDLYRVIAPHLEPPQYRAARWTSHFFAPLQGCTCIHNAWQELQLPFPSLATLHRDTSALAPLVNAALASRRWADAVRARPVRHLIATGGERISADLETLVWLWHWHLPEAPGQALRAPLPDISGFTRLRTLVVMNTSNCDDCLPCLPALPSTLRSLAVLQPSMDNRVDWVRDAPATASILRTFRSPSSALSSVTLPCCPGTPITAFTHPGAPPGTLRALTSLSLHLNSPNMQDAGLSDALAVCTALLELRISSSLVGPEVVLNIEALTHLQTLRILHMYDHLEIAGLRHVAALTELQELCLEVAQLDFEVPEVPARSERARRGVSGPGQTVPHALYPLKGLTKLTSLWVPYISRLPDHQPLTPAYRFSVADYATVAALPALRQLVLPYQSATPSQLAPLSGLTCLTELVLTARGALRRNRAGLASFAAVTASLCRLSSVHLSAYQPSADAQKHILEGLVGLSRCDGLRKLTLWTWVFARRPSGLSKLSGLQELEMDSINMTDEWMELLAPLTCLTRLALLNSAALTQAALAPIGRSLQLRELDMLGCVNAAGPRALARLTPMTGLRALRLELGAYWPRVAGSQGAGGGVLARTDDKRSERAAAVASLGKLTALRTLAFGGGVDPSFVEDARQALPYCMFG